MMNTRPQITRVEEMIRIPDWRRASPKNLNTLSLKTSPTTLALNRTISPKASIHPLGAAAMFSISSLDDRGDLGMGGQERLREGVVEGEDPQEGDDHGLVDRPPHPLGAAGGRHPLVAADDGDDRAE